MNGGADRERRLFPCWAVVERAPEGKWVAQCLDFNTLAQASDPETAVRLLIEATQEIVAEDLRAGQDPTERRAADEDWEALAPALEAPREEWFENFDEVQEFVATLHDSARVVVAFQFMLTFSVKSESMPILPIRARQIQPAPSYAI